MDAVADQPVYLDILDKVVSKVIEGISSLEQRISTFTHKPVTLNNDAHDEKTKALRLMFYTEHLAFIYNWCERKEGSNLADFLNRHGTFNEIAGDLKEKLMEYAAAYSERCFPVKVHAMALEDKSGVRNNALLDLVEATVILFGAPVIAAGSTYLAVNSMTAGTEYSNAVSVISGAAAGWLSLILTYSLGFCSSRGDVEWGMSHIDRKHLINPSDRLSQFMDRCYLSLTKEGRKLAHNISAASYEYREKRDALRAEYLPMIANK